MICDNVQLLYYYQNSRVIGILVIFPIIEKLPNIEIYVMAVSYTHLDVYKRQWQDNDTETCFGFIIVSSAVAVMLFNVSVFLK